MKHRLPIYSNRMLTFRLLFRRLKPRLRLERQQQPKQRLMQQQRQKLHRQQRQRDSSSSSTKSSTKSRSSSYNTGSSNTSGGSSSATVYSSNGKHYHILFQLIMAISQILVMVTGLHLLQVVQNSIQVLT